MEEALCRQYYTYCFPFDTIFNLFSRTPGHREFAFNYQGGEVYRRFKTFSSAQALKVGTTSGYSGVASAINVGAVYECITDQKTIIGRELIFDIDMNDYDNIRECGCRGKKDICSSCWKIARASIITLKFILAEIFGFKYMMCVYSGRRGYHIWILDKEAFTLDSQAREYIRDFFTSAAKNRNNNVDYILQNSGVIDFFKKEILTDPKLKVTDDSSKVFEYCWPRIDRKVTAEINHLSKCPFSMHASKKGAFSYILTEENQYDLFRPEDMQMGSKLYRSNISLLEDLLKSLKNSDSTVA